ncbi:hypothetical protein V6973_004086, partial [Salmonella enterica]
PKGDKGDAGAAGGLFQAYLEQQSKLTQSESVKQVMLSSGYIDSGKPVDVTICTDEHCRSLDVGMKDSPLIR